MSPSEPPLDATMAGDAMLPEERSARIVVVQGQGEPPVLDLHHAAVGVGRHADNDMVLASGQVSRFHLRIERQGKGFVVVDSGSHNGTWVNGIQLQKERPAALKDQDVIQVADFRLLFVAGDTGGARLQTIALDREKVSAEAEEALRRFLGDAGTQEP